MMFGAAGAPVPDCAGGAAGRLRPRWNADALARVDLRLPGIAVRKVTTSSAGQDSLVLEARPGRHRQSHADSRLELLYQDTLEAPIPQDMLRLLEKLGSAGRQR